MNSVDLTTILLLPSVKCFELMGWACPGQLEFEVEIYEISVCNNWNILRRPQSIRIKEIFIPKLNVGINGHGSSPSNGYNIIPNAQSRYIEKNIHPGLNERIVGWSNPTLLEKIRLSSDQTQKIFNVICNYIKKDELVKEIFGELI